MVAETLTNVACFVNMDTWAAFFSCLVTSPGVPTWNIVYIGILVLSIGGWSWFRSINEGMMVGGFLSSLMGLGLVSLGLVNVGTLMIAILFTITGLLITAIKSSGGD